MHFLCNFFFQEYKFENPFYEPPSVLTSARHDNVTSALWIKADGRLSNALNVWIEVSNVLLTPQKKYPRLKNLGTRNVINTQKAPLLFSFYLDRLRKFLNNATLSCKFNI